MAETYIPAQQAKPSAGVLANLYTVPAATVFIESTLVVCNQSSAAEAFRIAVAVAGAADALSQYLVYDGPILPNDSLSLTLGFTMGATDVLRVQSRSGNVSFSLFGVQVT